MQFDFESLNSQVDSYTKILESYIYNNENQKGVMDKANDFLDEKKLDNDIMIKKRRKTKTDFKIIEKQLKCLEKEIQSKKAKEKTNIF